MKQPIQAFKTLRTLCAALLALGMATGATGADAPSKYVTYVQSTGNQWVFLEGYRPTPTTRIEARVAFDNLTVNSAIFCARNPDSSFVNSFSLFHLTGGFRFDYSTTGTASNPLTDSDWHDIVCDANVFSLDDNVICTREAATFTVGGDMTLFASYTTNPANNPKMGNCASIRLASFKAYEGGTLVHDLYPCESVDGYVGLWDSVSNKLYTSKTTTALISSGVEGQGPSGVCKVTLSDTNGGTVAITPAAESNEYAIGTSITLTATPAAGYTFTKWVGPVSSEQATQNPLTLKLASSITMKPVFNGNFYVSATDGDDASNTPTNPETPLKTIKKALEFAVDGDTITLADGTYDEGGQIVLDKAITLTGSSYANCTLKNTKTNTRVVKIANAGAVVKNVTITGGKLNEAYVGYGCGAYVTAGTIQDCHVTANAGSYNVYGSGVALMGATAKAIRCVIDKNKPTSGNAVQGSGLYMGASAMAKDCLIANNNAYQGAGVFFYGPGTIINCTIVGNYASKQGGGVYVTSTGCKAINCIIRNNQAPYDSATTAPDFSCSSGKTITFANCATEVATTTGCTTADPVFKDYDNGDYTLLPSSSGIDTGDNNYVDTGDTDLVGNDRIRNNVVDMGCYEADPNALACGFRVDRASGLAETDFTFTGAASGLSGDVTYTWTFHNDTTGKDVTSTEQNPTFRPTEAGIYSVTLVASSGTQSTTLTRSAFVTVQGLTTYVDPESATPTFPYSTWATAAHDINDAIAACGDGGEVILAKKTIPMTVATSITRPITVRGDGDREETIIKQTKSDRVVVLNHANAILANVTLTGGKSEPGSGINVSAGLVTNCVISGNNSTAGSYGNGALHMTAGRATRCLVTGNGGGNGGAYPAVTLNGAAIVEYSIISNNTSNANAWAPINVRNGAILDSCLIARNYGASGGAIYVDGGSATVRNCTITKNKTSSGAGGIRIANNVGVKFINCLIAGNTSTSGAADWSFNKTTTVDWSQYFKNCFFDANPTGAYPQSGDDAGFTDDEHDDFTLKTSSKAIDAGTDAYGLSTYDLDGNDRVRGDAVDIGCYEADPYVLSVGFDCLNREGFLGTEFAITSTVSGVKGTTNYAWTVTSPNGESFTSTEAHLTIVPTAEGWYSVALTVTCGSGEVTTSMADYLHVAPRDIYVTQDAEGAEYPYDTPETATPDFATGWKEAIDGSTVHVSGTLVLQKTLEITKAITVVGVNGRDKDTLRYGNYDWGTVVLRLNNANALVRGLKLTNAARGIEIVTNGGTVEDCTSTGNYTGNSYTSGAGAYLDSAAAVVRRTIITNNQIGSGGGGNHTGGAGVYINKGLLENCLVAKNSGGGDGDGVYVASPAVTIRNCTIAHNTQWNSRVGGGIFFMSAAFNGGYPEIVNCLIVSNTTTAGEVRNVWMSYMNDKEEQGACKSMSDIVADVLLTCALDTTNETAKADFQIPTNSVNAKIVGDPCFNKDGSYRLTKRSPEILRDLATQQDWMVGTTDLYGKPRCDKFGVEPGCCQAPFRYGLLFFVK